MDQLEETEESSKEKNLFFLDESQYISKEEKKQAVKKKKRQKFKILERRMDKEESKGKEEIMTARTSHRVAGFRKESVSSCCDRNGEKGRYIKSHFEGQWRKPFVGVLLF